MSGFDLKLVDISVHNSDKLITRSAGTPPNSAATWQIKVWLELTASVTYNYNLQQQSDGCTDCLDLWLQGSIPPVTITVFLTWRQHAATMHTIVELPGMWSRSRHLGLETVSRRTNVSSRTKCSTSRSRLGLGPVHLGSRLGLGPKVSASRLGSRTFSSCQNFSSPIETSMT